jgi:methionyl aminopeptidase
MLKFPVMKIKTPQQAESIRKAALLATKIVSELSNQLAVGSFPSQLEKFAWELCKEHNVQPAFFGVKGQKNNYEYSCCISVNDQILHGIPSSTRALQDGDIVKIDFGLIMDGYYTDQCFTFIVGQPNQQDLRLVNIARLATETAVKKAISGTPAGDLGHTMEAIAQAAGFDTLKMFVGHGIGSSLHEYPEVPSFGPAGEGDILQKDMVICVECQVVGGSGEIYIADDGWTVMSADGNRGAMFEYMVIVGDTEPEILTPMLNWQVQI